MVCSVAYSEEFIRYFKTNDNIQVKPNIIIHSDKQIPENKYYGEEMVFAVSTSAKLLENIDNLIRSSDQREKVVDILQQQLEDIEINENYKILQTQDIEIYNELLATYDQVIKNHELLKKVQGKNVIFSYGETSPVLSQFVPDPSKSI